MPVGWMGEETTAVQIFKVSPGETTSLSSSFSGKEGDSWNHSLSLLAIALPSWKG